MHSSLNKATRIILQKCGSDHVISLLKILQCPLLSPYSELKPKFFLMAARSPQDLAHITSLNSYSSNPSPNPLPYFRNIGIHECAWRAPALGSLRRLFPLTVMLFLHLAIFSTLLRHFSSLINSTNYPILYTFVLLIYLFLFYFFFSWMAHITF